MAYWSIAALLVSVTFLAYRHQPEIWRHAPQWLRQGPKHTGHSKETCSKAITHQEAEDIEPSDLSSPRLVLQEHSDKEDDGGQSTPKANAADARGDVPKFSLSAGDDRAMPMAPPPRPSPTASTPTAANGAMAASPRPGSSSQSASSLMPPPPRPVPVSRPSPPASAAASLRVPSTGPLPNRGPPAGSQQRVAGGLAPNGTAVSTPNPRGKVLLSPGHSPMDWAALIRRGNISGVEGLQRVTPSQLKKMTGRKGKPAWSSWQGRVYNITPYLPFHPGGEAELMKAAGRDGGKLFMEVHPWVNWDNMLESCMVGAMVPE
ncbi:hypothetical protein K431DRAFT_257533, partial [Polychaeton citri CBS 116435]